MNFKEELQPFFRARIQLTGYYMLGITVLIGVFTYLTFDAKESTFIRVNQVVDEVVKEQEAVVRFQETFEEFNAVFRTRILIMDAILLLLSLGLSWWLSGRTLQPIQAMLEEQKNFAADVSHELRTPLTSIKLEIESFETVTEKMPASVRETLVSINEEVTRMTHMVQGLLLLVRSNERMISQKMETVDLNLVTERAVESVKRLAAYKRIGVSWKPGETVNVQGNKDQLLQVALILLDNAVKYSPKGSQVTVQVFQDKSAGLMSVQDEGPGIPKSEQKHIFDRFYRSSQQKADISGSGLGLAIGKRIMDAHQGTIQLISKPGSGSEFRMRLPLKEAGE